MSDRDTPTGPQEPTDGDTPTERIGAPGDDRASDGAPTERFNPRGVEPEDGAPTERFDSRRVEPEDSAPTERFDAADDAGAQPTRRIPQQDDRPYPEPRYPDGYSPTTRLPNPGSDAPTERFGQTPPWQPSPSSVPAYATTQQARSAPPKPPQKSKGPMIALIIIGTLLVVGIAVLLLVLATQGNTPVEPSASITPSETPSTTPSETPSETATPTPTPTPEPEPAAFVSFSPENNTQISCPDEESTVPLTFTWTSTDADRGWIAAGETDARANPDAQVDPSGTYRDLVFDCSRDSEIYTVSLENSEGELTSESVTLRRALDQ